MLLPLLLVSSGVVAVGRKIYKKNQPKSSTTTEIVQFETEEKTINSNLSLSVASIGLIVLGKIFYPPLSVVSLPILIYTGYPFVIDGLKTIFIKHKIDISVVDGIIITILLTQGYLFYTAIYDTFFWGSKKLLLKTQNRSKKELINIFGEQPRFVWILLDGTEIETSFENLKEGDIVVINGGETVPADGIIVEGIANIDEHALTGESCLVEKNIGDNVFALTIVLSGKIYIRVEKAGKKTLAAKITKILNQTADYKSSTQLKGQEISDKGAIPTLLLSAIAVPTVGLIGATAIMNSYVGYNMRIIGPLSVLNYVSIASKEGILIKDGRSLELLAEVDTVVFDKTGTLTSETPHIEHIYPFNGYDEDEVLIYAASSEYKQTHPVARAILHEAEQRQLELISIDTTDYKVGCGLKVYQLGRLIRIGSKRFMNMEKIFINPEAIDIEHQANEMGYSLIYVAIDEQLAGVIELCPTLRPEVHKVIKSLRLQKKAIYIISGDHESATKKLAEELGIHYFAEVLPEEKAKLITQLQEQGKSVCFIGDGINDSIAMKKAQVSISLHGASSVATDAAAVILLDGSLNTLENLFEIAGSLQNNMKYNFITSIVPGIFCIGGVFLFNFGIVSSIMLYNLSLATGVGNAMLPIITYKSQKNTKKLRDNSPS